MFLTIEDTNDEIDDEIKVDIELDTLFFGEVASERHNDMQQSPWKLKIEAQLLQSLSLLETYRLDIVSIYGNTPSIPWV